MSFFSFQDFAEADIDQEEYEAWHRSQEEHWRQQELAAAEHFRWLSLTWFKHEEVVA